MVAVVVQVAPALLLSSSVQIVVCRSGTLVALMICTALPSNVPEPTVLSTRSNASYVRVLRIELE